MLRKYKSAVCVYIKRIQQLLFPQNYLARNFYNLRFLALFVAFAINFILLFYKVRLQIEVSLHILVYIYTLVNTYKRCF